MKTRRKKRREVGLTPLPEAIAPGSWDVRAGMPMVDLESKQMSVPTANTPAAAFVRAHEMAHVKITPHKPAHELAEEAGISIEAMQSIEDLRVHTFLNRIGVKAAVMEPAENTIPALQRNNSLKILASMYVSIWPCAAQRREFERALQECGKYAEHEQHQIRELVLRVVEFFEALCMGLRAQNPLATPEGFTTLTAPVARFFDSLFDHDELISATEYGAWAHQNEWQWGRLEPTIRLRLTEPKRNKKGGAKLWREDGVIPTAPYRMTLDNKIFMRRRRKTIGGTVLIDGSGSMGFSDAQLAELVTAAPGARVAVYAGVADHGRLVIVADKGKMATQAALRDAFEIENGHYMYGNVVDGPALRWLAQQPGPRVWVSDGMVTGQDDQMAHNLRKEAIALMLEHDIERVEDWRDIVDNLG